MRLFFFISTCKNLVVFLGAKCGHCPVNVAPGVLTLATHQNFHLLVFTRLWPQWLPFKVSRSQLCLSGYTCLSSFGGGSWSCDLRFLISAGKVIDFPFVQHYPVIR